MFLLGPCFIRERLGSKRDPKGKRGPHPKRLGRAYLTFIVENSPTLGTYLAQKTVKFGVVSNVSKFANIRLQIEMVPKTLWNENLRYLLTNKKWGDIRKLELARVSDGHGRYRCEICTLQKESLDCHEIWHYNDGEKIQTLKGLVMLCKKCHLIKHIGMASNLAMDGLCNIDGLIKHFCLVNKLTPADFLEHYEEEYVRWEERSKHEWTQDLEYIVNAPIQLF